MTNPIESPIPAAYTDTTVLIPADWDYATWEAEAKSLQRSHRSMLFWLGDVMLWGEGRFGEDYAQAVETHSEETVKRAMRVCRKFPAERRRACGFSFHQRVEGMEATDQDEILDLAVKHDWRREQLDEEIARRRMAKSSAASLPPKTKPQNRSQPDILNLAAADGDDLDDGPRVLHLDDLPEPTPAAQEPERTVPVCTDDAAAFLLSVAPAALPDNIAGAIGLILKERTLLRRVAAAAAQAVVDDKIDPTLAEALAELRRSFP